MEIIFDDIIDGPNQQTADRGDVAAQKVNQNFQKIKEAFLQIDGGGGGNSGGDEPVGDFIPRTGTVTNKPVTGDIEMSNDTGLVSPTGKRIGFDANGNPINMITDLGKISIGVIDNIPDGDYYYKVQEVGALAAYRLVQVTRDYSGTLLKYQVRNSSNSNFLEGRSRPPSNVWSEWLPVGGVNNGGGEPAGDFIPRTGTVTNKPVTGNIKFSNNKGLLSESEYDVIVFTNNGISLAHEAGTNYASYIELFDARAKIYGSEDIILETNEGAGIAIEGGFISIDAQLGIELPKIVEFVKFNPNKGITSLSGANKIILDDGSFNVNVESPFNVKIGSSWTNIQVDSNNFEVKILAGTDCFITADNIYLSSNQVTHIDGSVSFDSGEVYFNSYTKFYGETYFDTDVHFQNDVTFDGRISVNSDAYVQGSITTEQGLYVSDNAYFNSGIDVSGSAYFNSGIDVSSSAYFQSEVCVNSSFYAYGDAYFQNDVRFSGRIQIEGNGDIEGELTFQDSVNFNNSAGFQSEVRFYSETQFDSDIYFNYPSRYTISDDIESAIGTGYYGNVMLLVNGPGQYDQGQFKTMKKADFKAWLGI